MTAKETAHGKTAHADNTALFVLTFARVAGECPANQEMTLIHKRNITSTIFTPFQIKLLQQILTEAYS